MCGLKSVMVDQKILKMRNFELLDEVKLNSHSKQLAEALTVTQEMISDLL